MQKKSSEALLTKIVPLSSHDGPGMRTTLFFKGCSMRCSWCHNPETINAFPELEWQSRNCIGCRQCEKACKYGAIDFSHQKTYPIDKEKCTRCFSCVESCPSKALNSIGIYYSQSMLLERILKDKPLLIKMEGGITFSGGEPALQSTFILSLAKELKRHILHLALDTCGLASLQVYKQLLPYIDILLFDLKEIDPEKHHLFTGVGNQKITDNLLRIIDFIREKKLQTRIWIRTPLVPGMTATEENISGIARFISDYTDCIDRWELCAFNNLCTDKYRQLGLSWPLVTTPLLSDIEIKELLATAKVMTANKIQITASGLTKK
ncbi:glycyl-radical enzyme activating protein [Parabacteroides sp. OttesenSCG-928-K15]|nr:glycyl-radical enzyme activating protein [Parabacteroides sp. OttesenSCG-928-K15]